MYPDYLTELSEGFVVACAEQGYHWNTTITLRDWFDLFINGGELW